MKIKTAFLLLFFLTFGILNISVGVYMVPHNSINGFLYFFIMQIINIGVAYRLIELLLSLAVKKKDLHKVNKLVSSPSVALLYVTYNDAMPDLLRKLKDQTYKNCDIFILDDSTNERYIKLIDNYGFKTIRRGTRPGFKAGSLNNWLSLYGDKYDYFVIADSDSAFENDFIGNMIKYAEHPSNKNVAIFQSKILPWNTKNSFSRAVGTMIPLSMYFNEKLSNECSTILSWGHNNLHRTRMIMDVGGFDENFVAEDYATGLNLIKKGYECKMVDVVSYEAVPETVQSYTKRYTRWAKQTLQLLKFNTKNIPFITKLHLFMEVYTYMIWIIFSLGMFIAVWGYNSSFNDLIIFINFIISGEFVNTSFLKPFMLIMFYILNFTFLRLPLALKLGISIQDYCKSLFLYMAISGYMMISLIKAELKTIVGAKVQFDVTDKNGYKYKLSLLQIIKGMGMGVLFNIVLLIGLIKNPVFLIFNFVWLIPFLLSPIVIYLVQKESEQIA
jgi:cellulose synthase/poly-beta-1,6-N-acetylglucosamine synthase-like glycosyltransferase